MCNITIPPQGMLYYEHVCQNQVKALREAGKIVREQINKIEAMTFSDKLKGFQHDFVSLVDCLNDSCVERIALDEEVEVWTPNKNPYTRYRTYEKR